MAPPAKGGKPAPTMDAAQISERDALMKGIADFEHENKTLEGLLESASPEKISELKKLNDELKMTLNKTEKALKSLLVELKLPKDAMGFADQIFVLKTAVVAYCMQNEIDPALWKNLEYL
ncbi:MAG: hypothetical protein HYW49_13215 [Deltaproteobacteria bacterium]|nr:hypothetical protein [Deltaproteobacteria bacterium]